MSKRRLDNKTFFNVVFFLTNSYLPPKNYFNDKNFISFVRNYLIRSDHLFGSQAPIIVFFRDLT